MLKLIVATTGFVLILISTAGIVDAAEIKALSAGALKLAMTQLVSDFQKSSDNTVAISYGPAGAIANRIQKGESADVVIVSRSQLEALENQGRVTQGSRVNIAGVGVGVAVRKGAPKPDVGSVDAFKRTLLSVRSIGYVDPTLGSSSGIYTAGMLEHLGIAKDLKAKIKLGSFEDIEQGVEKGEIEIQIGQISELVNSPGLDLAGPLPAEIQNVTWLAAGIVTSSKAPEAAKALISFISAPAAAAVLKAKGFDPG